MCFAAYPKGVESADLTETKRPNFAEWLSAALQTTKDAKLDDTMYPSGMDILCVLLLIQRV